MDVSANLIEGAHPVRNARRDFTEWHLGRSSYVFWALDVDVPAVRGQVKRAAAHLVDTCLIAMVVSRMSRSMCAAFPARQPAVRMSLRQPGWSANVWRCGPLRFLVDYLLASGGMCWHRTFF